MIIVCSYLCALIVDKINLYVNDRVLEMTQIMMYVPQFGQFKIIVKKWARLSVGQKIAATNQEP